MIAARADIALLATGDGGAELYLAPGQAFELGYANRTVGGGVVTSVFPLNN